MEQIEECVLAIDCHTHSLTRPFASSNFNLALTVRHMEKYSELRISRIQADGKFYPSSAKMRVSRRPKTDLDQMKYKLSECQGIRMYVQRKSKWVNWIINTINKLYNYRKIDHLLCSICKLRMYRQDLDLEISEIFLFSLCDQQTMVSTQAPIRLRRGKKRVSDSKVPKFLRDRRRSTWKIRPMHRLRKTLRISRIIEGIETSEDPTYAMFTANP